MTAKKEPIKNNYIFLDESGKPEVYSTKGVNLVVEGKATKYLILSAVRTTDQLKLQQDVMQFKADLLKDPSLTSIFSAAYTLDSFHAHNDYKQVKDLFYEFIANQDIKVDVMVVEKLKTYPTLQQNPGKLYGVMAGQLLKNICHQAESTEIIFSRKDSKLELRKELEIEVERVRLEYLEKHPTLNTRINLSYQHNPHYTHGGLQIADYIAYAIFQVFENNNREYYSIIEKRVGRIQDICNKKYYTHNSPL